ncbi:hypothetical protein B7P43_G05070 [Cryptotermes secundus]|uniref:MADF domain-containing protein n=2 Tax=Cryptotermes secundus TaxID=105785 RepID=A0A2J7PXQ8_9NEOP|nr:uncharacterized protein LOC111871139 isoform X4 [Cryptotermes secundus]XP_023719771.1 uncharacterized protein LOC111871139 isoform X4 [Cryptotermes secundus]XP_023719772.1 uncharacterized protein LOC111871139 isoform X4 [Cryptotermes secundus]XP_033610002.1 uncharacterized protein LOC111871139 isoform X4 [Cryptotermes secundus]XP_033610003.1 uncharacterized protein LOC111871139 isoform X4 [Cryptotermes secundus]PNF21113.1 hypothetical protein B7P43_G05070 [Cryptotermes secundus]PNF21115.1 
MDSNFNDMYQADTVATCDTAALKSLGCSDDVAHTEHLESDILLSIKKEDLLQEEEIHFSDGTSVGDSNKKFFELTPVEFEVQESFTNYDTTAYQESSDDRSTRTERKMPSKWSEEATLKFVKEYRQLECLWDVKSSSYRNKIARDAAYMKLADCASLPGFTVQEAKNKIKNLRSTYSQELKKVKQSKKSGSDEVYQPSLIWYKEIDAFLGPVIASRDTQTSMEAEVSSVMEEAITENEDTLEGNVQAVSPSQSQLSTPTEPAEVQYDRKCVKRNHPNLPPQILQCKKKKVTHGSQTAASSGSQLNQSQSSNKNDDEFDAFGKSVAAQLKKFSLAGALKTQVKIQSLLAQERITDAMESESMSPNEEFNHMHTPLTPLSHHSQASQNDSVCCNCVHEASQVYSTSEGLDDINSADILSQAVNSILPQ